MCINCYHRRGRTKKAWACRHSNRLHYSKGLCQNCYLAKYYIVRTSSPLNITSYRKGRLQSCKKRMKTLQKSKPILTSRKLISKCQIKKRQRNSVASQKRMPLKTRMMLLYRQDTESSQMTLWIRQTTHKEMMLK